MTISTTDRDLAIQLAGFEPDAFIIELDRGWNDVPRWIVVTPDPDDSEELVDPDSIRVLADRYFDDGELVMEFFFERVESDGPFVVMVRLAELGDRTVDLVLEGRV